MNWGASVLRTTNDLCAITITPTRVLLAVVACSWLLLHVSGQLVSFVGARRRGCQFDGACVQQLVCQCCCTVQQRLLVPSYEVGVVPFGALHTYGLSGESTSGQRTFVLLDPYYAINV